jgi:serine protease Do
MRGRLGELAPHQRPRIAFFTESAMRKPCVVLIALLAFIAALAGCATDSPRRVAPATLQAAPASFAAALARGLPVAVGVYSIDAKPEELREDVHPSLPKPLRSAAPRELAPWSDDDDVRPRIGAGFFISPDGLIATAAHVVADAGWIIVKLSDERVFRAELVAADEDTDIALVRVPVRLPALPLGSSASLRPGDWVLAVGEPYGLDRSVVAGIVGGRDRHFAEDAEVLFIQSDLSLNPGNSGGPLLDIRGSVVGMNLRTVIGSFGSPGLSLSMPIEIVQQIAGELASRGRIRRPRLGAGFEDVSPFAALAAGRGVTSGALINSVASAGIAERIGLLRLDIVTGMNGRPIGDSADLARALLDWRSAPGTRITVFRNGHYRQLLLEEP